MTIRPNRVKQKLKAGEVVWSSSVRLPDAGLCELLGYAGWDFVLLDGEHGAVDAATLERLIIGCYAGNTVPIVRVLRPNDPEAIMHALDLGAQGVLMPHCRTADDAKRLRTYSMYPPRGRRGFGPGRGALWGRISGTDFVNRANDEVVTIALIEDPEGVENIDEIAAVELDGLWVGTGDLALGYGVGANRDHPQVLAAAERILAACRKHNVACGYPARSIEEGRRAAAQGYRLIGFGGAEQYVMSESRRFLEGVASC
jgi:4-hydroxy-2-oxoheptanedioate aldolase